MKNISNILKSLVLAAVILNPLLLSAGNKDRAGQAGGSGLLINPWARSSGWGDAATAHITGLEAMYLNVAGTAFTRKTEVLFSRTTWFKGSDIYINSFGFTQRVGETGVMGLSIMSMDFGDIMITTVDLPEGGIGTFSPSFMNIGLSYAKEFSRSIYGGIVVKAVSESIADAGAQGIALDAGIRYVTGENDRVKFGIALKNVGPPMKFKGDGLTFRTTVPTVPNPGNSLTVEHRTAPFELPSLLNIGASYDFYLGGAAPADTTAETEATVNRNHRLTVAGNFRSNAFIRDQYMIGVEYGFKQYLMLRAGYTYEDDLTNVETRTTVFTGPSAGITLQKPLNDKGTTISFDYSYRATNPFSGTHSIGARINL